MRSVDWCHAYRRSIILNEIPALTRLEAIIKPAGPAPMISTSTLHKSRIVAFSVIFV